MRLLSGIICLYSCYVNNNVLNSLKLYYNIECMVLFIEYCPYVGRLFK